MLNITFLPKDKVPYSIKPITYHVDQENNVIAIAIAKATFIQEYKTQYYDKVAITETRVLR